MLSSRSLSSRLLFEFEKTSQFELYSSSELLDIDCLLSILQSFRSKDRWINFILGHCLCLMTKNPWKYETQKRRTPYKSLPNINEVMSQIVSELTVDTFSKRYIARRTFLRESMLLKGFHLPRTEHYVQQLIISRLGEVKN